MLQLQSFVRMNQIRRRFHHNYSSYIDRASLYKPILINSFSFPEQREKQECPICLQETTVIKTKCNHMFCRDCLSTYMNRCSSYEKPCPLCRQYL